MSEEEKKIQEAAEKGLEIPEYGQNLMAYQLLFKELAKEEETMPALSPFFAEKIATRIEERAIARMSFKEYAWKMAAIALFILLAVISMVVADLEEEILQSLASIKWYVIVSALLLVVFDFADKKLVKRAIKSS